MKFIIFASLVFASAPLRAHMHDHHAPSHQRPESHTMKGLYGPYSMSREASGTAWLPDSSPHAGGHWTAGGWMGMFHGYVYGVSTRQGGKRGEDRLFSPSMAMVMAQRPAGPGTLGLRVMTSGDPLMGKSGYPLLFQTGETADGRAPLIDRQHPHDLFMELAAGYSVPLSEESSVFGYAGLPGEPALGPAAFMHRFSGQDNPEAPLTHHWLDSTHITYGVVTLGYVWKGMKVEGSAFKGREPDENRWNFDEPKLDSYSARLTVNPTRDLSMQASYGGLKSPEELAPDTDIDRLTASLTHNAKLAAGNWQSTFAWGRNDKGHGHAEDGYILESAVNFRRAHTVFARAENVEKDELFLKGSPRFGETFTINKTALGYAYDFLFWKSIELGMGGMAGVHFIPDSLEPVYGKRPLSSSVFLRAKWGSL
jgi:hypothetical protein